MMTYTLKDLFRQSTIQKLLIVLGLMLLFFWPALSGMWTDWMQDSNNSHGVLVPLIVVYLIFRRFKDPALLSSWQELSREKDGPVLSFLVLFAFVSCLVLFTVGCLIDTLIFQRFAFVTAMQAVVLFLFGSAAYLELRFPLLFLYFMIPVPTTLYGMVALPLQLMTTKLSVLFLSWTSLPISSEGNIIHIGTEKLEVAEACSGLRSLMVFIVISALFAYLARVPLWKKLTLIASSVPIAIVGNLIRIIFTVVLADIYGSRFASGFVHDVSGYVMFALAFLFFMWFSKKLEGIKTPGT